MVVYQHDRDFSILVNGQELMHSRRHESELELARLGCAPVAGHRAPSVLIGGLGMGYTLRQTLDILSPQSRVVVSELLEAVVSWNRDFLGELAGHPLQDERVEVAAGDVLQLIRRSPGRFDAILLDVDNGPVAMTDIGNHRLYTSDGIWACRRAMRGSGCLAVWSAGPSKDFEQLLLGCGLQVRRYRAPAFKGSSSQPLCIWVASEDERILPPGGSAPRPPLGRPARRGRPRAQR